MANKNPKEIVQDAIGKNDRPVAERVRDALHTAGVRFWHNADGVSFATVPINGHIEQHRVEARAFKNLVRVIYGKPLAQKHMADVIAEIDAVAIKGPCREPAVRVIEHQGGVVIDLGRDDWQMVAVNAERWELVPSLDVPLVRPNGMRPMALPVHGDTRMGAFELYHLLNLKNDTDLMLCIACLVAALHPRGPYPVLAIDGEAGTAKSTTCRLLRDLIDPNAAALRGVPKNEEDIILAAANSRVVAFDNLSNISPDMADSLCRVATGAGFGTRRFYTNDEEYVVHVCRPVLFNGINSLLARGDLASRSVSLTLAPIAPENRRSEAEIQVAFEAKAPLILGALLDGLAMALRNRPAMKLSELPRMADFALTACAAAPAFGWTAEAMLKIILDNQSAIIAGVADADPIAVAVQTMLAKDAVNGEWEGTATTLLEKINRHAPVDAQRDRFWPGDGTRLSGRLRRVAPALRAIGIEVEMPEAGGRNGRTIKLRDPRFAQRVPVAVGAGASQGKPKTSKALAGLYDPPVEPGAVIH